MRIVWKVLRLRSMKHQLKICCDLLNIIRNFHLKILFALFSRAIFRLAMKWFSMVFALFFVWGNLQREKRKMHITSSVFWMQFFRINKTKRNIYYREIRKKVLFLHGLTWCARECNRKSKCEWRRIFACIHAKSFPTFFMMFRFVFLLIPHFIFIPWFSFLFGVFLFHFVAAVCLKNPP